MMNMKLLSVVTELSSYHLTTLYHKVPSNLMLVFKRLNMNFLNIKTLLNLKTVLGYHPNKLKTISTIFKSNF